MQKQLDACRREIEWIREKEEREKRKINLIISGLKVAIEKEKESIEEWMRNELGQDLELKSTWRLGKRRELIGVECKDRAEKERIMKSKHMLKRERERERERGGDKCIKGIAEEWRKEGKKNIKTGFKKIFTKEEK